MLHSSFILIFYFYFDYYIYFYCYQYYLFYIHDYFYQNFSQILAIHIPGVTDRKSQQQAVRVNTNPYSPSKKNNSNFDNYEKEYDESKNNEMRTIPLNIDDMPVGKGNGNGGNLSARGYEGESNADSPSRSIGWSYRAAHSVFGLVPHSTNCLRTDSSRHCEIRIQRNP